jgi:histidyl-tRNA synthetase
LLDGVLETVGLAPDVADAGKRRGVVLRAIDKLDRLGVDGVRALLGPGRKDESGDFTKGAGLSADQIARVLAFVAPKVGASDAEAMLSSIAGIVKQSRIGEEGIAEIRAIWDLLRACGYEDRVSFDTAIVRGLEYYTGTVFEALLSIPVQNEAGETVVFGSVGGGGRYDDLVARFTGTRVPAVGFSIGVSRLASALRARRESRSRLVVVLALDKNELTGSFRMAAELRAAGIRAEPYVGEAGMKAQLKYVDRRGAAVAVIEGPDERAQGEVTLKDMALGAELAKAVESRAAWVGERPAQVRVKRENLVTEVRNLLARKG